MLRPGRLDRMLYVPFPDQSERLNILKTCLKPVPVDPLLDLTVFVDQHKLEGFTGADLSALAK